MSMKITFQANITVEMRNSSEDFEIDFVRLKIKKAIRDYLFINPLFNNYSVDISKIDKE